MKFKTTLVAFLMMTAVSSAFANNLMIDEKSTSYDPSAALTEINSSIAAATVSTAEYNVSLRPVMTDYNYEGKYLLDNEGAPYKRPESYITHGLNGYILGARGKSTLNTLYSFNALELTVENKTTNPLIIDLNSSAVQIGDFYGQPFVTGKISEAGKVVQPNLIVAPNDKKTAVLYRSDAKQVSSSFAGSLYNAYIFNPAAIDFDHIKFQGSFKINSNTTTVSGESNISAEMQKKYDLITQYNVARERDK